MQPLLYLKFGSQKIETETFSGDEGGDREPEPEQRLHLRRLGRRRGRGSQHSLNLDYAGVAATASIPHFSP